MYNEQPTRDSLLITAGITTAYMNVSNVIDIFHGSKYENTFVEFIIEKVDEYLSTTQNDTFGNYIREELLLEYGVDGG